MSEKRRLEEVVATEKYQQLISEQGFTVIAVDVLDALKKVLFEAISTDVKNDLTSNIETSLKSVLRDCLATIQFNDGSRFLASWELIDRRNQVRLALESIAKIDECFRTITNKFRVRGLPEISYRAAIATSCIMEVGPFEGQFDAGATIHHVDNLLEISNSSPHRVLLSSETHKFMENKEISQVVLSPLMRIGVKEPLPIYTVEISKIPSRKGSGSVGTISKLKELFRRKG